MPLQPWKRRCSRTPGRVAQRPRARGLEVSQPARWRRAAPPGGEPAALRGAGWQRGAQGHGRGGGGGGGRGGEAFRGPGAQQAGLVAEGLHRGDGEAASEGGEGESLLST